jgi:hypothetical protein
MSNFPNDRGPSVWWMTLLIVPFAGALGVPLFDRPDPEGWSPSFFVCYQLLWIASSALAMNLVYSKMAARLRPVRRAHRE